MNGAPEGIIYPFMLITDDVEPDRYSMNPLKNSIVESGQSAFPSANVKTENLEIDRDFFHKYEDIPLKEKKGIRKVIYYNKEKVIVLKSLIGDKMYENLENLVKKYGWYFYITGVPVGSSEISLAID